MRNATIEEQKVIDRISIEAGLDCSNVIEGLERIKTLLTEIEEIKERIFGKQGNDSISYKDVFNATRKANEEYREKNTPSAFI